MNNGTLYVIGTPIGNLQDITLRAIETLNKIEVLYCEDSRVTATLINSLLDKGLIQNKPRYVPYNEFNEAMVANRIVQDVLANKIVGLVSDAGMPVLSDPGYRAVRACLDNNIKIEVIPGPTALTTALTLSGIGGEVMNYLGFLPKTSGKAMRVLEAAKAMMDSVNSTKVVLYVSPHRLMKDLVLIKQIVGDVHAVLLKELTKQFETRVEGSVATLIEKFEGTVVKGELVLILQKPVERKSQE